MKRTCVMIGVLWMTGCSGSVPAPPLSLLGEASPRVEAPAFNQGRGPVVTGWEATPERLRASYCAGCHEDVHEGWRAGMHRRAWRDPLFEHAFRREERRWCVHCHAPLAAQREIYDSARARREASQGYDATLDEGTLLDEGVNCAACHVRGGQIFGVRARPNDAHPVYAAPSLEQPAFCGGCHQFNFPRFDEGEGFSYTDRPMQNTVHEWRDAEIDVPCVSCHMAANHQLRGPHDDAWMRSRFSGMRAELDGGYVNVSFDVAPRGHRVPSGDLFHSLAVEVASSEGFEQVVARRTWARFFRSGLVSPTEVSNRVLAANTGLYPEEHAVSVRVRVPVKGPVFVRLVYHYHDAQLGGPLDDGVVPASYQRLVIWQARVRP